MARYVKACAVAPAAPMVGENWDPNHVVEYMIDHWDNWLGKVLPSHPDIIALPEACDRPANLRGEKLDEVYRARGNRVCEHFAKIAEKERVNIAYSASRIMDDGTKRNSTQFIDRNGKVIGIYNKNYLVVEEYTQNNTLYGRSNPVIETDFGTVGGVICFDLNFQPLRERYKAEPPDILVFCSMYHGGLMQNYWAYDCRCHLLASVCGSQCTVVDPVGRTIAASTNYFPYVTTDINLDCCVVHLDYNWDKLRAAEKKYGKGFKVSDPGYLGCVLISSETDYVTVDDIVKEFDIELWDDYYKRALQARDLPGRLES